MAVSPPLMWKRILVGINYHTYMLTSKGKTCMVEEPSDVIKHLSLNQMCKTGLMLSGKVFHSPLIPGIRPDPVETVNILQDSATFRLVYNKPDIPFHFLLFFLPMQSRGYFKKHI
jgi:hypothetical protein